MLWTFIDSAINKFSSDSESETSLKIGQYLTKLRRTKQSVPVFLAHYTIETTNGGSSRIDRFPNLFIYECHDIDAI